MLLLIIIQPLGFVKTFFITHIVDTNYYKLAFILVLYIF